MIPSRRVQALNAAPERTDGRYVLYWMQQSQRAQGNSALEFAIGEANRLDLPVLAGFGLTAFPEANARHYDFMLRGLAGVARDLRERGVGFTIRKQRPDRLALALAGEAALVVCDRGYLRVQRAWREALAADIDRRLIQIEGDVVVPVEAASDHHEYAARTLRPKLHRLWDDFLLDLSPTPVAVRMEAAPQSDVDLSDITALVAALKVDQSVAPVRRFPAGEGAARAALARFVAGGLGSYAADRNRPELNAHSSLSPYLHFGQISPVDVALAVRAARRADDNSARFLEELIVRRELACNHAFYEPGYDRYESLPGWARDTLAAHADDPRPFVYDLETFEAGRTHDPYWNAAMREMRVTGYMHNQMRMYWGKKVLHWSRTPEEAWSTLLALNNRSFLDGRDPNGFTNVGWIFGLHDRPWGPQPVFGTVRSMGPNTFKKFDADAYVARVDHLARAEA